jgi:pilus assembly protein FimV
LRFSLLVGTALISSHAWAGLGKINVRSALGEPFRAEIPLTAISPADLDSTKVGLADADTFRQFQIDYASVLSALRFSLIHGNSGAVIRVTSSQPISEPFLRFVLEARNSNGRSVREYTVLLDPPEYSARPVEVNQAETVQDLPKYADDNLASRFRGHVNGTPGARSSVRPSELVAGPGNRLSNLAARVRPHGASLTQTMAALMQANPDAFIDGNPQRLKSGAHLKVPSVAAIRAISNAEARQILGLGQPASAATAENGAANTSTEPAAHSPASPKAQPSLAGSGKSAGGSGVLKLTPAENPAGTDAKLNELETQVAARDKSLKDAEQRIAALEAQIAALKGGGAVAPAAPASSASALGVAHGTVASAPAVQAASAPAVQPKPKPVMHATPAPKPEEVPKPGLVPQLLAKLMDNLPLIGGGVIVLLLLGLLAVRIRQRRRGAGVAGLAAAVGVGAGAAAASSGMLASAAQGMAGGHSFMSDFTRSFGEIDAGEVDPVAEAEVYIAYGRDEQAEEILKDALVRDPARHEVRMKLLEIYVARQDKASFERIARELHTAFDGKGQLWGKAAALGQALDPGNPLYELKESAPIANVAAAAAPIDLDQELMSMQQPAQPPASPPVDLMAELEAPAQVAPETMLEDDALRNALFGEEPSGEAAPAAAPAENMLDFDLDSLAQEAAAETKPEPEPAPAADNLLDFDFPVEDLNKEAAPEAAKPAEPVAEEPLGDFAALYDAEPEKPLDTSGITVSDDPLSTKLDLAKVYLDMGDSDGAREVLKELLDEAQGALKDEAQALLTKLGG